MREELVDCQTNDVLRPHPRDQVGLSVWLIGPILGALYSLSLGRHAGYDFLNVRWFLGWLLMRDVEGMPGAIQSLAHKPYLNEAIVGLLSLSGVWWLPVVVLGAVHGIVIPLAYDICRAVAPDVRRLFALVAALLTLASPLTSVQVGRESGHLLAAVALLASIRHVARRGDNPSALFASVFMVLAIFFKYSSILTVAVSFVTVVFALPLGRAARALFAFLGTLWLAVTISSMTIWPAGSSRLFAFGGFSWESVNFVIGGLAFLTFSAFAWGLWRSFSQTELMSSIWSRYRGPVLGTSLIGFSLSVQTVRIPGDPRFVPDSLSVVVRRLLSTGDLRNGSTLGAQSVRDLEYVYFDLGKGVAILIASAALLMLVFRARGDSSRFGPLHLAVIPGVAVWVNMASYGYVRYATEALVLLPVGVFALLSTVNIGRLLRSLAALGVTTVLLLPVLGVGGWRGYGLVGGRPGHGPLISGEDAQLLSGLIPRNATVFFFGELTTWVAPAVDRVDPTWYVKPIRPRDAEASSAVLFYDLSDVADLDKFTTREWVMTDCQALRFENVAVGWCRLDADLTDE